MKTSADEMFTTGGLATLGVKQDDMINIIKTGQKVKVHNEFVLMFVENFERLVPILTKTEMRVLLCVVKYLNYQNVFGVNQARIASDIGINTANCSRAMKSLKDKNILAEKNGVSYINPYIFTKGHILEVKKNIKQISFVFDDELETDEIKKPF